MLETILSLVMALAMVAFGAFCGVMAVHIFTENLQARREGRRSKTWPAVEGRVVRTDMEHIGVRAGWKPVIEYEYEVNGLRYAGQRLMFEYFEGRRRREAQAILDRYPPESKVQVYYDPARPQEATLVQASRGTAGGLFWLPPFLLLPTAMCIGSGLVGLVSTLQK